MLGDYEINTYKDNGDAYLPITLLANIVTGCSLFTIVYNEEALFEFDYGEQIFDGVKRDEAYYGDTYNAPMVANTKRTEDMAKFSYNLICMLIDNFRGFTTQMAFIDNNVLSLGLNGTLEKDKTEADKFKSLKIVLLTSSYAFSCGNLLPSILKELGYRTIGEKTGGGSCAIMVGSMGDGPFYVRSSYKCLSNEAGNNIDSGVDGDVSLIGEGIEVQGVEVTNYEKFFDYNVIAKVLKELFA